MLEKWQALIAQLEVHESSNNQEIWIPEDFQAFEAETGIILPDSYRGFCQVFGTGLLGDYMRIYCPNTYLSNVTIEAIKNEISQFLDPMYSKVMDVRSISKLLDSAFVFGDNASADVVFWDLRTYRESDKSYDIYLANSDCFDGEIHQVGREFYEFICDFCLGMKSYEVLPESMRPLPEALTRTFTRGSLKGLSDCYDFM